MSYIKKSDKNFSPKGRVTRKSKQDLSEVQKFSKFNAINCFNFISLGAKTRNQRSI